ncbi:hypothetical protein ACFL0D_07205 [Thermoproteota archaeon]
MVYKLYISRSFSEKRLEGSEMERIFRGFQEIYEKNGVNVIGAWENEDDSLEYYLITHYRDNDHYQNATTKMRTDPEYVKLSKVLQDARESIKVVNLKKLPGFP